MIIPGVLCRELTFDWPVNFSTLSPDGNLCAVVGDDPVGVLMDMRTDKQVAQLKGHYDFSFAAAWHPGGNLLATGNQVLFPPSLALSVSVRMGGEACVCMCVCLVCVCVCVCVCDFEFSFAAAWHPGGNLLAIGNQVLLLFCLPPLSRPVCMRVHPCVCARVCVCMCV